MPPYVLSVRHGGEVERIGYPSRSRLVAEATHYAEMGYIVGWEES